MLGLIAFSWLSTSLVAYTTTPDTASPTLGVLNLALILLLLGPVGVLWASPRSRRSYSWRFFATG